MIYFRILYVEIRKFEVFCVLLVVLISGVGFTMRARWSNLLTTVHVVLQYSS